MLDVVSMIIHHIKDNGNACLMEGIHHLLELTNTAVGIIGVGGVTAFGHIVVHRIVTPIILVITETCLVHRAIVIAGQNMDGIDA